MSTHKLITTDKRFQDITHFTIEVIKDGKDSIDLIERMLDEEKYEELAAIKLGYKKMGKPMPMPE